MYIIHQYHIVRDFLYYHSIPGLHILNSVFGYLQSCLLLWVDILKLLTPCVCEHHTIYLNILYQHNKVTMDTYPGEQITNLYKYGIITQRLFTSNDNKKYFMSHNMKFSRICTLTF